MKRVKPNLLVSIFSALILITGQYAYASWASFVHVTPGKINDSKVSVSISNESADTLEVTVTFPEHYDSNWEFSKKAWLITARTKLSGKELRAFRHQITRTGETTTELPYVEKLSKLNPNLVADKLVKFKVLLNQKEDRNLYIYFGHGEEISDGGYYYGVDIPAFIEQRKSK